MLDFDIYADFAGYGLITGLNNIGTILTSDTYFTSAAPFTPCFAFSIYCCKFIYYMLAWDDIYFLFQGYEMPQGGTLFPSLRNHVSSFAAYLLSPPGKYP